MPQWGGVNMSLWDRKKTVLLNLKLYLNLNFPLFRVFGITVK